MPDAWKCWFHGYDGVAALWASLAATTASLLMSWLWLPASSGGGAWIYLRMAAATLLGPDVLAPPATFEVTVLLAAIAALLVAGTLLTLAITFILHRWGLVAGVLGGALIGLAAHLILVKTLSLLWPWLVALDGVGPMLASAVVAAVAGGVYELLDETDEGVVHHAVAS